jgi:hypothetical protein
MKNDAPGTDLERKIASHRGTVVLMDCEFGHMVKFWFAPMTGEELEKWWAGRDTFGSLGMLERLIVEIPLSTLEFPGWTVLAETDEQWALWNALEEGGGHYYCHIFDDEFSYLKSPDGRIIHHKGYRGRDIGVSSTPEDG